MSFKDVSTCLCNCFYGDLSQVRTGEAGFSVMSMKPVPFLAKGLGMVFSTQEREVYLYTRRIHHF